MPIYEVECVHRDTGATSLHRVEAADEVAAKNYLANTGFIVGAAVPVALEAWQPVPLTDSQSQAVTIVHPVRIDLRAVVADKRFRKALRNDIAWGVVGGLLRWTLLIILAWIVLFLILAALGAGLSALAPTGRRP